MFRSILDKLLKRKSQNIDGYQSDQKQRHIKSDNIPTKQYLRASMDDLESNLPQSTSENNCNAGDGNKNLEKSQKIRQFVDPGHFFSPIPSKQDILEYQEDFESRLLRPIPAIHLNKKSQLALLEKFGEYYSEMPFSIDPPTDHRYFLNNNAFNYLDGLVLYSMLRYLQPSRLIEIGCGYSSCVTLDTNELFLDNKIDCEFIEPYPELLYSLIKPTDLEKIQITSKRLQEVELSKFSELNSGDVLFIDSTHVSRVNSDVNYIFFEILPVLKPGVIIHFHDIYYPFEYPIEWHLEGRVWTECYITRAFLEFNPNFEIMFWGSYLNRFFQEKIQSFLPLGVRNAGGSFWLKKVI